MDIRISNLSKIIAVLTFLVLFESRQKRTKQNSYKNLNISMLCLFLSRKSSNL